MLFNSYIFALLFLPGTIVLHGLATRIGPRLALGFLVGASIVFYASWDARYLVLLLGSIAVNHALGRALAGAVRQGSWRWADRLLVLGLAFNLAVLGWFKYTSFILANLNGLSGLHLDAGTIVLPLGISFFTFEQIGYLIDVRRGHAEAAPILRYALFVSFFPRLVAGPVLRYGEMAPQFDADVVTARRSAWVDDLAVGLTLFTIGLLKKALLADGVAPFVRPAFDAAAAAQDVEFFAAWSSALAYTVQIYFDFSGYSDMAIGVARCFGIRFPANFASPYKAGSIIEFWRRWHITLSRFLRDYLYIGLGGNRHGPRRRYLNLMATMLLGGLWHGANWTFVIWGGLHGLFLCANHAWVAFRGKRPDQADGRPHPLGWLVTFLAVVIAWVFFRAPSLEAALRVLQGMAGMNGALLPRAMEPLFGPVLPLLQMAGIGFGDTSGTQLLQAWAWVLGLLLLALLPPNSQQILAAYAPTLDDPARLGAARWLLWRPVAGWGLAVGIGAFVGLAAIANRNSEFLYWQF